MKKILLFLASFVFFFSISSVYASTPTVNDFSYSTDGTTVTFSIDLYGWGVDYLHDYKIQKSINGGVTWSAYKSLLSIETDTFTDTPSYSGLAAGTYKFRIVARNGYYDVGDVFITYLTNTTVTGSNSIVIWTPPPPPPSSGSWTPTSGTTDCVGGVPVSWTRTDSAPTSGTLSCVTHKYYSSNYTLNIGGTTTGCNWDDRVVGVSWSQITCQRYDDIDPSCGSTWTPSPVTWTNTTQTFTNIWSSDGASGLSPANTYNCSALTNGATCNIIISDNAGNTATCTSPAAKIDTVPPVCGTWTPSPVPWSGTTQTFTLSNSTDTTSWIQIAGWNCNAAVNWTTCMVLISDNAGNSTTCTSPVAKIDTTPPVCGSWTPGTDSTWRTSRTFNMSGITDSQSGPTSTTANCTDAIQSPNSSTKTTCNVTITDIVGNSTICTSPGAYIDTSPATASLSCTIPDSQWKNNASVTCTATVTSTGPSPTTLTYSISGPSPVGTTAIASGVSFPVPWADGQYIVTACATDTGGTGPCATWNVWRDQTNPSSFDVSPTPVNNKNLLATTNQPFSANISVNGGSPIISVETQLENKNFGSPSISHNGTNSVSFNWDISIVDGADQSNGGRQYTWNITKICDGAGNCALNVANYNYYVFANTSTIAPPTLNTTSLTNWNAIADGTWTNFSATMQDIYGNVIIPATANGMNRKINFTFNYSNSLYLNQIETDISAVYFKDTNTSETLVPVDGLDTLYMNQNSTNGTYDFAIKSYSPSTNNTYHIIAGNIFSINTIKADIIDTIGSNSKTLNSATIDSAFKPMYYTNIGWAIKTPGFAAWQRQDSTIEIKHFWWINVTLQKIQWTFSSTNYLLFGGTLTNNARSPGWIAITTNQTSIISGFNTSGETKDIYTLLKQRTGTSVGPVSDANFNTVVNYQIDWKTITYYSDRIGNENLTYQVGVKILGITSAKNIQEIISSQLSDDIKVLWNQDRFLIKTKILQNVGKATKNTDSIMTGAPNIVSDTLINWGSLGGWSNKGITLKTGDKTILYIKPATPGWIITLWAGSSIEIQWNRTLLVVGGNIYVKNDIYYNDTTTDLLSLVAVKDEAWNGGNIYIDPAITNISATLFTSKWVLSYRDGIGEIWGNEATAGILKNQLYIYGSVVSLNTIGWSGNDSCPYFVTSCDTSESQKYDLNYLRRFFLTGTKIPNLGGKVAWWWSTCNAGWCTSWSSPTLPRKTIGSDQYTKYPVIIEYNPTVQTNPSWLFTTN